MVHHVFFSFSFDSVGTAAAHDLQGDITRLDALEDGDGLGVRQTHQRFVVDGQNFVPCSHQIVQKWSALVIGTHPF